MTATFDECPGLGRGLYIGGFIGLRRKEALKNCNITHIVSVLDWEFKDDAPLVRGFKHLHIPVDDVEDENLLEWFPTSNRFIKEGLEYRPAPQLSQDDGVNNAAGKGSGVYIHCAMGKSRSATILLAYLLWSSRQHQPTNHNGDSEDMVALPPRGLSVAEALELLRQGRPICEPNEGFMDQLHMYEDMGCPTTDAELKAHKIYRRWMNRRKVEESLRVMQAPEMENIIFEDESDEDQESGKDKHMKKVAEGVYAPDGQDESKRLAHASLQSSPQVTIKCRKCRHALATTPFIVEHKPPPHRDPSTEVPAHHEGTPLPPPVCAHVFLHPLSWMKQVLSEGKMEGRLTCPNSKCGTNIGKFSWSGLRCSCGGWVTPGFGLIRGKVDEVVNRRSGSTAEGESSSQSGGIAPNAGIRLPPGMKRQGNL